MKDHGKTYCSAHQPHKTAYHRVGFCLQQIEQNNYTLRSADEVVTGLTFGNLLDALILASNEIAELDGVYALIEYA